MADEGIPQPPAASSAALLQDFVCLAQEGLRSMAPAQGGADNEPETQPRKRRRANAAGHSAAPDAAHEHSPEGSGFTPQCILITGGAGFIASHVAVHLVRERRCRVVVLDKLDYCANMANLRSVMDDPLFTFVKGDITCARLVAGILRAHPVDTIMHFAAHTHVEHSFAQGMSFSTNNILGTHVLLEAARRHKVKRFVHISTDEVYGQNTPAIPVFHEASPLQPTNPYAATKASAEMLCFSYFHSYGLPVVITRGNNVYGPGQHPEKLIPKFCYLAAKKGNKLPIHGDGNQKRSYLFVSDAVHAFATVLERGVPGAVYNIGSPEERSVLSVANDICKLFKRDPASSIAHVEDRLSNDKSYLVDSSALHALGWQPKVAWKDGLKRTCDWLMAHEDYWTDLSVALQPHALGATPSSIDKEADAPAGCSTEGQGRRAERILIFSDCPVLHSLTGVLPMVSGYQLRIRSVELRDRSVVMFEVERFQPTHIIAYHKLPSCDAGADSSVSHHDSSILGMLNVADVCREAKLHCTIMTWQGASTHPGALGRWQAACSLLAQYSVLHLQIQDEPVDGSMNESTEFLMHFLPQVLWTATTGASGTVALKADALSSPSRELDSTP